MIAIVDYGVGNLYSLHRSFEAIGAEVKITADEREIKAADRILLPGVGAFGDAANKLYASGLSELITEEAKEGKPLLGICLGMQMLLDKSLEYGEHRGLGLIEGEVRPISEVIPKGLKIPHIGWNALQFQGRRRRVRVFRPLLPRGKLRQKRDRHRRIRRAADCCRGEGQRLWLSVPSRKERQGGTEYPARLRRAVRKEERDDYFSCNRFVRRQGGAPL